ncbi:MAG: hypothetical protein JSS51_03535 [Planctomycetes bacterium]|nr:hypothetical protein [Planctomycetota bacterium]
MSYAYHLWREQSTEKLQLAMLDRHLGEVSAKMDVDVSGPNFSTSRKELQNYIDALNAERDKLLAIVEAQSRPIFGRARLMRP